MVVKKCPLNMRHLTFSSLSTFKNIFYNQNWFNNSDLCGFLFSKRQKDEQVVENTSYLTEFSTVVNEKV